MHGLTKAALLFAPLSVTAIDIKTGILPNDGVQASSWKDTPVINTSTSSDGGSIINYPAGAIGDSAVASINILANKNQLPKDKSLEFQVEILSSEQTCGYGNILLNGEKLTQEPKDGVSSGKGLITSGLSIPIAASWNFECLTLDNKQVAQLFRFNVEDIAGRSVENIGFALSFKQTGITEIIRIESGTSRRAVTTWLESRPDEDKHAEPQKQEEFPELDFEAEIAELAFLRIEVARLKAIIDHKERALEEHRMAKGNMKIETDIKKCDSLKCIVRLTLEKARGAAHVVYGKMAREGFFGEKFEDRPHGLHRRPHHGADKFFGKQPYGEHFREHRKGNGTCSPPPRFDRPDKHHGPPPPRRPHGPPPPSRGSPPPPPHHGPPPPFDDEEDFYGSPPPPDFEGGGFRHHRGFHHGPPPPFHDEENFKFRGEDGPPHHQGPPLPPFDDEDKPQHPFPGEDPDSKLVDASVPLSTLPEILLQEFKPDRPHPLPPMGEFRGPPPHGPHGSPLRFFFHFLKFLAVGFMLSILLLTLHRRHLANARRANRRPNALSRFFSARFGLGGDGGGGDEDEKSDSLMDQEDIIEGGMDSEIQQLRNVASVVSDIVAAEEGRFVPSAASSSSSSQAPSAELSASPYPQPHFARIDSLPGYRPRMGVNMTMTSIEDNGEDIELPAYEDNDGSEGASVVQDGFGYMGPGSNYTPSGSETSSLHEVLGAPKN